MELRYISKKKKSPLLYRLSCLLLLAGWICAIASCKKFLDINPPVSQISAASVYSTNASAAAVMTGVYDNMITNQGLSSGPYSISMLDGLAADELTNYGADPEQSQFYGNALSSISSGSSNNYFWTELYNEIHVANSVLDGLATYKGVTPAMKQQLTGEALFMRAFLHFYAVNLYGDVPLVTTSNYLVNNTLSRTPKAQVYQQIIQDLINAQNDLSSNFVNASGIITTQRVRPNKGAAAALLARVYLYYGDLTGEQSYYTKAIVQTDSVIGNSQYKLVTDLNSVFLANSNEAIWQLPPTIPGNNTYDAISFVLTSDPGSNGQNVALSSYLQDAFEPGDNRFVNWVGSFTDPSTNMVYYYPNKYKVYLQNQPVTEYTMVMRLVEQYLIRSEAEAQTGDAGHAVADLNIIRQRAGLAGYTGATDKSSLLTAILHERQVELFSEWGHRWFDLKRSTITINLNTILGSPGNICASKGGSWNPDWELVPLPLSEIQYDHNLTQNPGY